MQSKSEPTASHQGLGNPPPTRGRPDPEPAAQAPDEFTGRLATWEDRAASRDHQIANLNFALQWEQQAKAHLERVVESALHWQDRSWFKRAFGRWQPPAAAGEKQRPGFVKRLKRSIRKRRKRLQGMIWNRPIGSGEDANQPPETAAPGSPPAQSSNPADRPPGRAEPAPPRTSEACLADLDRQITELNSALRWLHEANAHLEGTVRSAAKWQRLWVIRAFRRWRPPTTPGEKAQQIGLVKRWERLFRKRRKELLNRILRRPSELSPEPRHGAAREPASAKIQTATLAISSTAAQPASSPVLALQRVKSPSGSLEAAFLEELADLFSLQAFVETGTFLGNTTAAASRFFAEVHTMELSPELAAKARARFANTPSIKVYEGDSAEQLPQILASLTVPALFWLDGHYSEGITARGHGNTPILEEVAAIARRGLKNAVILVDDLRLFERSPKTVDAASSLHGYPTLAELQAAILKIDPGYQFFVYGDVALAFPATYRVSVSRLIHALTLSRMFEGGASGAEATIKAEQVIGRANGAEAEVLGELPALAAATEAQGFGLCYRLWHGLALLGQQDYFGARQQFLELQRLGFKHWRLQWYLALASKGAGNYLQARALVESLAAAAPDFAPAAELRQQFAEPATTATASALRPMLTAGRSALEQLAAAGVYDGTPPLRLHLGCGEQHFDGYVNIDYPPSEHSCQVRIGADVFADITKLQFPPQSVAEIRLHHVFEHFKRAEALAMLIRWHAALATGGRLHLETPDLEGCARQLVSRQPLRIKQAVVRHCFGSQEAGWANHYDGWTAERFRHVLSRFGFSVQTRNWRWPHPPHLANVEAIATKERTYTQAELLSIADALLSEYMTAEVTSERGMCEVWRKAMRDFLAGSEPARELEADPDQRLEIPLLPPSPATEALGFDDDNQATNGESLVIQSLLRPGNVVLDVGANEGDWSRQVLASVSGVCLHAFEPSPETVAKLRANLPAGSVTIHPLALADHAGETTLFRYTERPDLSGMNSRYRRPEVEQRLQLQAVPVTVRLETLDGFCAAQGLGPIDFLKIDTEGSELEVLRGARQLLATGRLKLIQFEYGGTYRDAGIRLRQVYELLAQAGCQIFRITGRGLVAVPRWEEALENYRYANYLAVASQFILGGAAGGVVVKLQGGLGNQMFQFAAGLALARRHGARLKLDLSFLRDRTPRAHFTRRDFDLNLFHLPADCEMLSDGSKFARRLFHHTEQQFDFDPRFLELGPEVYLDGYFQSPRYFESVREEVWRTFRSFVTPLTPQQQALADKIRACAAICLNVRRDDYVANPVHNQFFGVCDESYFRQAVAEIQRQVPEAHFFIFSDDEEWCRSANLTNGAPFTVVTKEYAGDRYAAKFQLMMTCRHFIVPNSSYGWWAAFLAEAPDKIVVAPTPWFDHPFNNSQDLVPASWLRLPKNRAAAPRVSVIIPCHNYAAYLAEAVRSVWSQTYRSLEIILVEDGSSDNSAGVAQQLAAEAPAELAFRIFHLNDVGPAAARRFGFSQARGQYLLPLDADDWIAPDFLAKTVPLLEADPKLGFAYVDTVYFGGQQQRHRQPEYQFARLCRDNFISHCSLIRKAAFDQVGGYDPENWGYYEDWDLWIRLGAKGWFGRHVGEPLYFYRHHFTSSLSLFARRLKPVYTAFLQCRHPEFYPRRTVAAAHQTLAEMPPGWNLQPPMRNLDQLKSQLAQDPQNRHLQYFLGCVLLQSGALAEAESVLRKLVGQHPDDTLALEVLRQVTSTALRQSPGATPLVSVIVPTHNRHDWLGETLQSILAQTYREFEIIVVNDAGRDVGSIIDALNASGRIRLINHEQNKGLAGARNTGLRAARGQYIAYLDDDDIYYPQHLAALVAHSQASGAPVVYSDACRGHQRQQGEGHVVFKRTPERSPEWDRDRILVQNFVPVLCFLHHRKCVEAVGGFDESLTTHEDWDLWMRLSRLYEFSHLSQVTCEFRWRDDGSSMSSSRQADFARTARIIYQKHPEYVAHRPDIQARRNREWRRV